MQIACLLHMVFILIFNIHICLLIQSHVNKSSASHHVFLFTYGNCLFITCGFRFNIQYLFFYLFKAMSTKAAQVTTCFYLPMQITCCHTWFSFEYYYLFVYLFKVMSTKAGGTDHLFLFTYANSLLLDMVFVLIFIIYLFIYSKRCKQKHVEPKTCFYLLMQITCCETWFSF